MADFEMKLGRRIQRLRKIVSISQEEMAKILGVSRPTVSQIENGERKVSTQELVILARTFNVSIENLLDLEREPEVFLPKKNGHTHSSAEIRIAVPRRNLEKFKEVFLYILNKVGSRPNIGQTVLYKLLYFIDFDHYELYEEQLIGATYVKNHHGPTPIEFGKIMERMITDQEIEKIKSDYFQFPQTKYLPRRAPDLSKLKASEIDSIDKVLNRFMDWNAAKISEYSHGDVPWLTTEKGKIIPYESVFYRTDAYSVRNYCE